MLSFLEHSRKLKKLKKSIRKLKKSPKILPNSRQSKTAPNFFENIVKFRKRSEFSKNNFEKVYCFRTLNCTVFNKDLVVGTAWSGWSSECDSNNFKITSIQRTAKNTLVFDWQQMSPVSMIFSILVFSSKSRARKNIQCVSKC